MNVKTPQAFFTTLASSLEKHQITDAEALAIKSAVESLSPTAPLTWELLDRLQLSAGVKSRLILMWLHHRYPEQLQVHLADSLAGALRGLLAQEPMPDFAVEFYQSLMARPKFEGPRDLAALSALLAEGELSFIGENQGKVAIKAATVPLLVQQFPDQLAAGAAGLALIKHEGELLIGGEGGKVLLGLGADYVRLADLSPSALENLQAALGKGLKNAALGPVGRAAKKEIGGLIEAHRAPEHPAQARLDTVLRLELGTQRVGESRLESLNRLIEDAFTAAELARQSPAAVEEALALGLNAGAPTTLPNDGYRGLDLPSPKAPRKRAEPTPEAEPPPQPEPVGGTNPVPAPAVPPEAPADPPPTSGGGSGGGWGPSGSSPGGRRVRIRGTTQDVETLRALVELLRRGLR